jgi:hypothetical protein
LGKKKKKGRQGGSQVNVVLFFAFKCPIGRFFYPSFVPCEVFAEHVHVVIVEGVLLIREVHAPVPSSLRPEGAGAVPQAAKANGTWPRGGKINVETS